MRNQTSAAFLVFTAIAASAATFNVRDYGARGDAVTKDTAAIQRALDACAGTGGTVHVPRGVYLTGSIYLGDRTTLDLAEGATIVGSPDLGDYNPTNAYPQNWGSVHEGWSAKHLILAIEKKDVAITGRGVIDGNGRAFFADVPDFYGTHGWRDGGINARGKRSEQNRPGQEIVFVECNGVKVRDVTFRDMSCWSCFFFGCENVVAGGVTVLNGMRNLNTDGFDIDSCRNVRVGDCYIETGDDAIAIRGCPAKLRDPTRICENVRVSNIVCRVSADGVRVGVGNGGIRDVVVSDMDIRHAGTGLHVQCCYSGTGKGVDIEDVTFERIRIREAGKAVSVMAGSGKPSARLANILFRKVDAETYVACEVRGAGSTRPRNVVFEDCVFMPVPHIPTRAPNHGMNILGKCSGAVFDVIRADEVAFKCSWLVWDASTPAVFDRAFNLEDSAMPKMDKESRIHNRR